MLRRYLEEAVVPMLLRLFVGVMVLVVELEGRMLMTFLVLFGELGMHYQRL